MKPNKNPFLLISAVFSVTATAQAAPLLTDNFDVGNTDASTFNNNLATTQGGSFAPITYSVYAPGGGYTAQHSNAGNMIVVGNGGIPGGRASLNRNFAIEANYADKPLSVSFNLDEVSDPGDPLVWGHFGLGSTQNGDFFGTDFAIFFRSNGQWQTRDNGGGADLGTGTYADGDLITFVFSNTAGTGSAFNGNGSKVTITAGAAAPVTYTLAQLTAADGFLTWGGYTYGAFSVMAIDNLSVDMDGTFPAGEGFVWSGAVDANWDEATANWSNVNSLTKWFNNPGTPNSAVFDATGSAQPNVALALSRPLEVGTLTFDTAGYTLSGSATLGESPNIVTNADATISAALNGGVSLTKSGLSTLTLTATNSYSGSTAVDQGTLEITSTGKIYGAGYTNSPVVTVANGATLRVNNWNYDAPGSLGALDFARERLVVNGGTIEHAGNSNDNGGAAGRNLTIGTGGATLKSTTAGQTWTIVENAGYGPVINDNGLTLGGAGDGVIAKPITGTGTLTKADSGTWTLTGANTYTGNTTVNGGTLSLASPSLDNASTVIIGTTPGSTLDLNFSGNDIVSGLEINGSGPLPAGAYDSSHPTYGSYFSGSGTLVVAPTGNGTWTSLVDGNWEDPANWLASAVAYGTDSTATFNAATGATVTLAGGLTIGNLVFDVSDYTLAGSTLTLDASATTPFVSVGSGRSATISADVAGIAGLEKTGAGTLVLTGNKSYSGGTTVTNGTLELQGANSGNAQIHGSLLVGSGATLALTGGDGTGFGYFNNPVTSIYVDGGTINAAGGSHLGFGPAASLTLDNGATILGNWEWNGDGLLSFFSSGNATNTISGNIVLRPDAGTNHTFNVDDGDSLTDLVVDANLADFFPAQPWGTSGLTKAGTGTMILEGNNTYDGNTVVSDGTLEVSASSTLRFRPTTNGVTNSVSSTGTGALSFLGTVDLDLGAANATGGNVWNLFNLASFAAAPDLSATAGVTSTLGAFTEVSAGTWELAVTSAKWVFTEVDGNLAYVVTATDYDNWEVANGVTGGENDDDDADGLTNSEEYAFGTDPTGGSSANPIVIPLDKAAGTFSYTRRATPASTGLSYSVWTSTDLGTWTQDAGATEGTPTVSGEVETVPVTISPALLSNSKLFIQVRAD